MKRIVYATAECTGGGIYCYIGKLDDGKYFIAFDDEETVLLTDTDPESCWDDIFQPDWQKANCVEEPISAEDWNRMTDWIVSHEPGGNYLVEEIERRRR